MRHLRHHRGFLQFPNLSVTNGPTYRSHTCFHRKLSVQLILSSEWTELHANAALTMVTIFHNFVALVADEAEMPEVTTAPLILFAHIDETLRGGSTRMQRIIAAGDLSVTTDEGGVVLVSSSSAKRDDVIETLQNTSLENPEAVYAALGIGHFRMPYSMDDFR